MFGYVIANLDKLPPEEKQRYRSCFCGLCNALGDLYGTLSRITLNYDMTFLILILSSLYRADNGLKTERCFIHPTERHPYWRNEFTDYAAGMNVALTYYNLLDKWTDDKRILSLAEARLFEGEYKKVSEQYPEQCAIISGCLNELSGMEKSGVMNPDYPANCFGRLMGEIFAPRRDEYSEDLQAFGRTLGRFIYIMDACLDLKKDLRKERYNPMIATSSENFSTILNILMADCTEKYRKLPIEQDRGLIENILYSGVWTRYEAANNKAKGKQKK